ncbi:MAG: hypothetical protein WAQ77_20515 [Candidatus Acidiferrum sp.]
MISSIELPCDGCGQNASTEHIARRLQRLEWATRYRPIHIQTLFLGSASPQKQEEVLYSPNGEFLGEAGMLLEAAGVSTAGKTAEAVHAEFQRAGFFLTHVLECPIESESGPAHVLPFLMEQRLTAVAVRIRRSLKPKRVVLISRALETILEKFVALPLGCPLVLDDGKPFALDESDTQRVAARLRGAVGASAV